MFFPLFLLSVLLSSKVTADRNREYGKVPGRLKDDEVIPNFSDIPSILTSIRHPRRRAISIGPQSEADAYETLAYREKRRRESISDNANGFLGRCHEPLV